MIFIEILLALLAGCFFGIITGLIPGVHINLISIMLISISGYLLGFTSPIVLGVFIIAMSITHTFLDSIPSIFLGAPDPDQALLVLPGHKLLLEGKGFEAVKLTVIGSLLCLISTILIVPLMIPIVPAIYSFISPIMGYILIAVVLFMILKEKIHTKKFNSFLVFLASGALGLTVLNLPNLKQPLFPMLSGIFGISMLLISLNNKIVLPEQKITETIKVPKKNLVKVLSAGTFSGTLTGIFPGLGAAQAAIIGSQLVGKIGSHAFIILVGGINTVNFLFSLVTLYTLEKARNGAVIAVMEIIKQINLNYLIVFLSAALIAGSIATFLALSITRVFAKLITKVNYKFLCISVISFVTILVTIFSGWMGLLVLIVSTFLGMTPSLLGVGKNHAMGCLLLPVILFFIL